jgi:hypothetical protein
VATKSAIPVNTNNSKFMRNSFIKRFKSLSLVLLLMIAGTTLTAQRGWEAGPGGGISNYFGDLNTNFRVNKPGLTGSLNFRYNFNNRICMKFAGNYGSLSASDADSKNVFEQQRNLSFESIIIDGSTQFEFNFLPYTHGSADEFFTPYLFVGLSVFHYNPMAEYEGQLYELRELGTEGQFKGEEYLSTSGAWLYGIGLKMDINYQWSINFELGLRSTFTDYLDDVSSVYPDNDDVRRNKGEIAATLSDRSLGIDNPISKEGRQRGNANNNDNYSIFSVSMMYYFGSIRCPEISRIRQ